MKLVRHKVPALGTTPIRSPAVDPRERDPTTVLADTAFAVFVKREMDSPLV